MSSATQRTRRAVGSNPALPPQFVKVRVPIYLDLDTPVEFDATKIRDVGACFQVKPEAVCSQCGYPAATHKWTGLEFLCPGDETNRKMRDVQRAEVVAGLSNSFAATDLSVLEGMPEFQRLLEELGDALRENNMARVATTRRRIDEMAYLAMRARNRIDKNIEKDAYSIWISTPAKGNRALTYRDLQDAVNELEGKINEIPEPAQQAPPASLKQRMLSAAARIRSPLKPIYADDNEPREDATLPRPKRNYGDDY